MSLLKALNTDFFQDIIELHNEGVIGFTENQIVKPQNVVSFDYLLSPMADTKNKKRFLQSLFSHYGLDVLNISFDSNKKQFIIECFDTLGRVDTKVVLLKGA